VSTTATLDRPPERAAPPSAFRGFAGVFVAGGVAGMVIGGLGSRLAMRIAAMTARDRAQGLITEAGATIGRITFEGTVFLILFAGIGSALVGTAFYLATLPPGSPAGGRCERSPSAVSSSWSSAPCCWIQGSRTSRSWAGHS
jgi:hypothetical protein